MFPRFPQTLTQSNFEQHSFAEKYNWKITNPSIVTYVDLGKMGRLGNQLFEIAATIGIAKRNQCGLIFPCSIEKLPLTKLFQLDLPLSKGPIVPTRRISELSSADEIKILPDKSINAIEGYRQSREYLQPIQEDLQKIFSLKDPFPLLDAIVIHIRRTDCIKNDFISNLLDRPLNCSLDYYQKSIFRLRKNHYLPKDYPVIVTTDDRTWVKKHLKEIDLYAELNHQGSIENDFKALAAGKYLVISNSTFSLWGALLNPSIEKHFDQIIAPGYWFHPLNKIVKIMGSDHQNICPKDWLFQDPHTGEILENAYQHDRKECFLRKFLLSNHWRW
jgi:hypothetical protein